MKVAGIRIHFIVAAILLAANARAQDEAAAEVASAAPPAATPGADAPYAGIVARNMFGLLPIPPPDPHAGEPPVEPPPKITPNGIMTIFGRDQALFKVVGKTKPGQPAHDDSYVLAEGERQDDIEVVKINHDTSVITFNNHGIVQELPLVPAKETGGPAPAVAGGPMGGGPMGGQPRPGSSFRPGGRGGNVGGGNPNMSGGNQAYNGNGGGNNGFNSGANGYNNGAYNGSAGNGQQPQGNIEDQVMNAARQMALIEQTRMDTQDLVNQGAMPPLPPTMLTPDEALTGGGAGGAPLVNSGPPGLPGVPGKPNK